MSQSVDAVYFHGEQLQIDYTPGSAITAGKLLSFGVGTQRLVAVANVAIPASKLGAVEVKGVYKVKKKADVTFAMGQTVEWDEATSRAVDNADGSGDFAIGTCVQDGGAAADDDTVLVAINMTFAEQAEGSSE